MTYADYEWYIEQNLSRYDGEWIAIMDKHIIAHDKNVKKVLDFSKQKYPNKRPIITKINNKLSIF